MSRQSSLYKSQLKPSFDGTYHIHLATCARISYTTTSLSLVIPKKARDNTHNSAKLVIYTKRNKSAINVQINTDTILMKDFTFSGFLANGTKIFTSKTNSMGNNQL